jgi:hypothetical protein
MSDTRGYCSPYRHSYPEENGMDDQRDVTTTYLIQYRDAGKPWKYAEGGSDEKVQVLADLNSLRANLGGLFEYRVIRRTEEVVDES